MNKHRGLTIGLIMAVSIFAIHVFYLNTESLRVDMTQTKLYSLTPGTEQILTKMADEGVKPIEITLYFSASTGKTLPRFIKQFITYENYVHNLLREYELASNGKIKIDTIDPKTDSDEAEDAKDYRLDGKPINQEGDLFYFGMVFETQTGSKDVIDFLWPEKQETIEYEISKKIYNLLWPKKKRVAVMSGLDPLPDNNPYMMQMMQMQGKQPTEPWLAMKVLEETYTVTRLADVDTISKDEHDILLVIHPKAFNDKQLWAIDEWVVTGGDTLVFLDFYSIEDKAPQNPQQPWAQLQYRPSSNLTKLMDKWGVSRPEDVFAVDYEMAVKRPTDQGGISQKVITDLLIDEKTAKETLNQDLPIFNGLNNLRFFMSGVIKVNDDAPAEVIPMITTTTQGSTLKIVPGFGEKELAFTDLGEPSKLLDKYSPDGEKSNLAVLIRGTLPSAFPQGASFPKEAPKAPPGMPPGMQMPVDENAEMITKEAVAEDKLADARVLIFADVDFITNQVAFQKSMFGVQAVNDNHKILLNSIDYLLGAKELMNVRSKEQIARPFEYFDLIEAQADNNMREQEQSIRNEITRFQEELRNKQRGMNEKDAVLFQKKMADDIESLNAKIREREKTLRDIRKQKRSRIEDEETFVRASIMWMMPILIIVVGIFASMKRRTRQISVRKED